MIEAQWSFKYGLKLHNLQLQLLKKGFESLEVGGRMIYSTCSMNPIENESVVAAFLNSVNGAAELINVHPLMPSFKMAPGLSECKPFLV